MAEAFSFFAEEISKGFALVWGGVTIASDLNYRLMTVIISSTSRIVQLLFLLTQKVVDVFSIIAGDVLLFIGDIGKGTIAFLNLFYNFVSAVLSFIVAMVNQIANSVYYLYQLLDCLYSGIIYVVAIMETNICIAFVMIRDITIIFGSSMNFIITFIPNIAFLLICETIYAIQNLNKSLQLMVWKVFSDNKQIWRQTSNKLINYFTDIPFEAAIGIFFGILLILIIKLSLNYIPDNIIRMPDSAFSKIANLKRNILGWYSAIWNAENIQSILEHNGDMETMDDGSDENGNDNNQNIPDRNLEREQIPVTIMRPPYNSIDLVRRPLNRYHRRIDLILEVSDDELVDRRKTSLIDVESENQASCSENISDRLQKQLEDERENQLCIVCQDERKNIILLPCRHLCLCTLCNSSLLKHDRTCPICRKVVTESFKVYL